LLVTDNYSKGWRITPLDNAGQQSYEIMPANYTLMAIPLKKGEHKLRLEYSPFGYRIGKQITAFALLFYIFVLIYFLKVRKKASLTPKNAA